MVLMGEGAVTQSLFDVYCSVVVLLDKVWF